MSATGKSRNLFTWLLIIGVALAALYIVKSIGLQLGWGRLVAMIAVMALFFTMKKETIPLGFSFWLAAIWAGVGLFFLAWLPWGFPGRWLLVSPLFYYPYQLLLSVASLRAVYRFLRQQQAWEKTAHSNLHRQSQAAAHQVGVQS